MCWRKHVLIFTWTLCALFIQSCVSWKKINRIVKNEPPAQSFSSLRISNYATRDSNETGNNDYYSFYRLNKITLSRKDTLSKWREVIVQLDSMEKGLTVSFFWGDILADRYFLKGEWKDNYFYVKRRVKAKGMPPLYFFYHEKLGVLGKQGSELALIQSEMKMGMIVLFSAGGENYFHERYSIR